MDIVTVNSKFRVTIPQCVRRQMGIKPGERLMVKERDNVIYFIRIRNIKNMRGFLGKKISTKGVRDESERFG